MNQLIHQFTNELTRAGWAVRPATTSVPGYTGPSVGFYAPDGPVPVDITDMLADLDTAIQCEAVTDRNGVIRLVPRVRKGLIGAVQYKQCGTCGRRIRTTRGRPIHVRYRRRTPVYYCSAACRHRDTVGTTPRPHPGSVLPVQPETI